MNRSITDVKGITVGSQENLEALTGCTVVLTGREGAICGVDVRGSAPGTRETDLLSPINAIERVHAVLLTGGSSFGLDAACGIMDFLEEQGIGHQAGPAIVPIVPGAVLFDLAVGDQHTRPDRAMGYRACQEAGQLVREGNAGAGTGATVGKIRGIANATKAGLGTWSIRLDNGLVVGALVAVNALGDVINPRNGQVMAGVRGDDGKLMGTAKVWMNRQIDSAQMGNTNTTIAVIATNAQINKNGACKVAQMAHDGLARVINPIHTMLDGDTVFTLATGEIEADLNQVGYLAAEVLAQAVLRGIETAETIQGHRSYKD